MNNDMTIIALGELMKMGDRERNAVLVNMDENNRKTHVDLMANLPQPPRSAVSQGQIPRTVTQAQTNALTIGRVSSNSEDSAAVLTVSDARRQVRNNAPQRIDQNQVNSNGPRMPARHIGTVPEVVDLLRRLGLRGLTNNDVSPIFNSGLSSMNPV